MKKSQTYFYLPAAILVLLLTGSLFSQADKTETGDITFEYKKTEIIQEASLLDIMLLPREKYFNRVNLEEDIGRLNKYYFDNGFFDVAIDTVTSYDKDDNETDIKFIIIENSQYLIKEIRYQGLDSLPPSIKSSVYSSQLIEPGNPYNKNKISQERDRIIGILQNNGYYYAQIDTIRSRIDSSRRGIIIGKFSDEMQKNPEYKNKVLVRLRFIGTKEVYRFGKINIDIEKNKYDISKDIITREIAFKEGEIFNRSKLIETERNFSKLAIIQLGRVVEDTILPDRTIDMNVNITINNKYELTPSIYTSYQSNRLFLGANLEYKDKYFFGGGRTFSITTEGLYNSRYINGASINFSLFQPFLFNRNITATLSPEIAFLNINKNTSAVVFRNLLRLSYYIADYTFYNNAYSDLTFDYVNLNLKITDEQENELGNFKFYFVNSIIGLNLVHNNTNSLFNPSKGFYHTISAESAGALPRLLTLVNSSLLYSQYVKLSTVNSFYFDISDDRASSIVATHFEIGDIIEYGSGENIVAVDKLYKFFMGGGNSIRGWGAQKGGILDNPEEGGKFLLFGSVEWRRKPFPQRSFLYPLWGVLFFDYGNVWESDRFFRMDQIALAAGFGVRYDSFVGPIRIDLGFKLYDPLAPDGDKWLWQQPGNIFKSKYAIQFGLGNAY